MDIHIEGNELWSTLFTVGIPASDIGIEHGDELQRVDLLFLVAYSKMKTLLTAHSYSHASL